MKSFFNSLFLFIPPVSPLFLITFLFVFIDTFTGRKKAKKLNEEITSRKTRFGIISKLITYFSVIIMAYLLDYFILNEITTHYVWFNYLFTRLWAGVLIWIEWTSINENLKVLKGYSLNDKAVQLITLLKKVISELMTIKQQ